MFRTGTIQIKNRLLFEPKKSKTQELYFVMGEH